MATLAETLRQVGYVTPQGVTGPNAPLARQLKNYVANVIPTAAQNLAQQRADIDASLTMGDQGIQVGDRAAFERALEQVPNLMGSVAKLPTAERMKIAQANAALPVEQGGLGLPPNNTPLQRAEAMGYKTPAYHGTNADIEVFDVVGKDKTAGAGAFFTTNPVVAETYVSGSGGGNILPVLIKEDNFLKGVGRGQGWGNLAVFDLKPNVAGKPINPKEMNLDPFGYTTTDEIAQAALDLGLKGTKILNVRDLGPNSHVFRAKEYLKEKYGIIPDETWSNVDQAKWNEVTNYINDFYKGQKSDVISVQDPSLIRSKYAAFDPKRSKEGDILAGALAVPMVADEETRRSLLEKLFNEQQK